MIICGDLHFGKVSDSIMVDGCHSQTLDVLARLDEIKSVANPKEVIVIAGDIFNKVNPRTEIIGAFFTWLGSIKNNVILLPGNHDCGVEWANIGMLGDLPLDHVKIVTGPTVFEVLGDYSTARDIGFLPHIPHARLADGFDYYEPLAYDKPELVIGHGMVKGLDYKNDIFFEAGNALEIDVRKVNCKLMVLGHVHKNTVLYPTKSKTVVYPGSVTINNFGEVDDEKGFVRVDLLTLDWEFVPFRSEVTPYRDILIDLVSKDTVDLSDDVLKEVSMGAVIKIRVLARNLIQVEENKLRKAFNKYGYVSRFETTIQKEGRDADVDTDNNELLLNISHDDLVQKYIGGCEASDAIKKLAISQAREIIREVLDAE